MPRETPGAIVGWAPESAATEREPLVNAGASPAAREAEVPVWFAGAPSAAETAAAAAGILRAGARPGKICEGAAPAGTAPAGTPAAPGPFEAALAEGVERAEGAAVTEPRPGDPPIVGDMPVVGIEAAPLPPMLAAPPAPPVDIPSGAVGTDVTV